MGRKRRNRSASSLERVNKFKQPKLESGFISARFVWAKLPRTPVMWPVKIINPVDETSRHLLVYVNCDNADLTVEANDTIAFPGEIDKIKKESLDKLKKKNLIKTSALFMNDLEWALEEMAIDKSLDSAFVDSEQQKDRTVSITKKKTSVVNEQIESEECVSVNSLISEELNANEMTAGNNRINHVDTTFGDLKQQTTSGSCEQHKEFITEKETSLENEVVESDESVSWNTQISEEQEIVGNRLIDNEDTIVTDLEQQKEFITEKETSLENEVVESDESVSWNTQISEEQEIVGNRLIDNEDTIVTDLEQQKEFITEKETSLENEVVESDESVSGNTQISEEQEIVGNRLIDNEDTIVTDLEQQKEFITEKETSLENEVVESDESVSGNSQISEEQEIVGNRLIDNEDTIVTDLEQQKEFITEKETSLENEVVESDESVSGNTQISEEQEIVGNRLIDNEDTIVTDLEQQKEFITEKETSLENEVVESDESVSGNSQISEEQEIVGNRLIDNEDTKVTDLEQQKEFITEKETSLENEVVESDESVSGNSPISEEQEIVGNRLIDNEDTKVTDFQQQKEFITEKETSLENEVVESDESVSGNTQISEEWDAIKMAAGNKLINHVDTDFGYMEQQTTSGSCEKQIKFITEIAMVNKEVEGEESVSWNTQISEEQEIVGNRLIDNEDTIVTDLEQQKEFITEKETSLENEVVESDESVSGNTQISEEQEIVGNRLIDNEDTIVTDLEQQKEFITEKETSLENEVVESDESVSGNSQSSEEQEIVGNRLIDNEDTIVTDLEQQKEFITEKETSLENEVVESDESVSGNSQISEEQEIVGNRLVDNEDTIVTDLEQQKEFITEKETSLENEVVESDESVSGNTQISEEWDANKMAAGTKLINHVDTDFDYMEQQTTSGSCEKQIKFITEIAVVNKEVEGEESVSWNTQISEEQEIVGHRLIDNIDTLFIDLEQQKEFITLKEISVVNEEVESEESIPGNSQISEEQKANEKIGNKFIDHVDTVFGNLEQQKKLVTDKEIPAEYEVECYGYDAEDDDEDLDDSVKDPDYIEESDTESEIDKDAVFDDEIFDKQKELCTSSEVAVGEELVKSVASSSDNCTFEQKELVTQKNISVQNEVVDDTDDTEIIEESDIESDKNEKIIEFPSVRQRSNDSYSYSIAIAEKNIIRDSNMPGIFVRKVRKSTKASRAQAKSKKVGNERVYDNFHACLFCGGMRQHIGIHLKVHRKIPEVKQVIEMEKPNFTKLRKLGDHKHNQNVIKEGVGDLIISRRPDQNTVDFDSTQYGPCTNCKEWLLLKNMKRHLEENCTEQKVSMSKRQAIIMSQAEAGIISSKPSKLMLTEVFPSMQMDDIADVAKKDESIVALGESWLRRSIDNREKRRYYTSQHMRLMAKVLIELRRLDSNSSSNGNSSSNDDKCFADYLKPTEFDKIVAAALECCFPFMDDIEELKAPSNGIKIKYDLRRMLTARWAVLVKKDPHSLEAKEVKTCLELVSIEWGERITKLARAVMVRRQFSIKKELPAPADVEKLTTYVASELRSVELKADNFTRIVQLGQTRILLYNKRRSGEIDAIRLISYAGKSRNLDEIDESLIGELTKVEKYLLKSQDLMKVRGKGNRPVPVLIPNDLRKPLDFIASRAHRIEAGVPEENDYLFPLVSNKSGFNPARCYESMKKICTEISLLAPSRITSVSMRKYTATLTQMLNLDKNQMEWVCQHLGHTGNVHKAHYRQMSGFIERVHVTKMFLLQDMNLTNKFKGQKLDEIDISDIVFPSNEVPVNVEVEDDSSLVDAIDEGFLQHEREDGGVDKVVFDSDNEKEDFSDSEEFEEPLKKKSVSQGKVPKAKACRQRFDKTEMDEIQLYFKSYLNSGTCPRTKAVEVAKSKSKRANGKIWMRTNDKIIKKISNMNHK